jgi:hypothetical protein
VRLRVGTSPDIVNRQDETAVEVKKERVRTVGLPMLLLAAEVRTIKKRRPGMVIDLVYY